MLHRQGRRPRARPPHSRRVVVSALCSAGVPGDATLSMSGNQVITSWSVPPVAARIELRSRELLPRESHIIARCDRRRRQARRPRRARAQARRPRSDVYVRRDPSKDGVVVFDHQRITYQLIKGDDVRPALGSASTKQGHQRSRVLHSRVSAATSGAPRVSSSFELLTGASSATATAA